MAYLQLAITLAVMASAAAADITCCICNMGDIRLLSLVHLLSAPWLMTHVSEFMLSECRAMEVVCDFVICKPCAFLNDNWRATLQFEVITKQSSAKDPAYDKNSKEAVYLAINAACMCWLDSGLRSIPEAVSTTESTGMSLVTH